MTPLHIAAKRGHKNSVENLVDSGTDVDITDREGVCKYTTDSRLVLEIS